MCMYIKFSAPGFLQCPKAFGAATFDQNSVVGRSKPFRSHVPLLALSLYELRLGLKNLSSTGEYFLSKLNF